MIIPGETPGGSQLTPPEVIPPDGMDPEALPQPTSREGFLEAILPVCNRAKFYMDAHHYAKYLRQHAELIALSPEELGVFMSAELASETEMGNSQNALYRALDQMLGGRGILLSFAELDRGYMRLFNEQDRSDYLDMKCPLVTCSVLLPSESRDGFAHVSVTHTREDGKVYANRFYGYHFVDLLERNPKWTFADTTPNQPATSTPETEVQS